MPLEYLAQKRLEDGIILRLKTWESTVIRPGARMFQLELVRGGLTIQYPTDYENHTEAEVVGLYEAITSKRDFNKARKAI